MKKTNLKIIILFFALGIGFLSFNLFVNQSSDLANTNNNYSMLAAAGEYVPITQNLNLKIEGTGSGIMGILNLVFIWGIRIAIALALVFVVLGAVQYMTSADSPGNKGEGKQRMQAAIGGLILALVSWLILNTINPDILTNNFLGKLNKLDPSPAADGSGSVGENPTGTGGANQNNPANPTETPVTTGP